MYKAIKATLLLLLTLLYELLLDLLDICGADDLSNPDGPLLDHALPLRLNYPPLLHHLLLLHLQHLILPLRQLLIVVRWFEA